MAEQPRVRLIHWNAAEAAARAERLAALGYAVNADPPRPPGLFKELAQDPPAAVVVDLSRLPSQGRDVGVNLRMKAGTRHVPLVFVGGDPEKVAPIRALLPDATYTSWEDIGQALAQGLAAPPSEPVVPKSIFAAFEGRPLAAKLGIKPGMSVALVDAPEDFATTLGELPEGARLQRGDCAGCGLILWFVRNRAALEAGVASMVAKVGAGGIWIIWPKRGSGVGSDLTQPIVREIGVAAGLMDYKICSVDETWSGLLSVRRNAGKG
ncbi:MAG: hypothetical protein GXY76_20520 [Chloroflexi bacterium]|nr:hypothetical protein [Chloroflexota bacterium]